MIKQDPEFWTPVAVILLAVAIEHGILGLKVLIAAFIPDVPGHVEEQEQKRDILKHQAIQDLQEIKHRSNALSFDDIKREYEKEQAMENNSKWIIKNL
jgi:hypothetical protein